MIEWAKDKKPYWEAICKKYGGNPDAFDWGTWGFFDWSLGKAWPTIGTNNKARKYGWTRVDDTVETLYKTFKSFEHAGILPAGRTILADDRKRAGGQGTGVAANGVTGH